MGGNIKISVSNSSLWSFVVGKFRTRLKWWKFSRGATIVNSVVRGDSRLWRMAAFRTVRGHDRLWQVVRSFTDCGRGQFWQTVTSRVTMWSPANFYSCPSQSAVAVSFSNLHPLAVWSQLVLIVSHRSSPRASLTNSSVNGQVAHCLRLWSRPILAVDSLYTSRTVS